MRVITQALVVVLAAAACAPTAATSPTPTASAAASAATSSAPTGPSASAAAGLTARPTATVVAGRWGVLPDGFERGLAEVTASFPQIEDAGPGRPRARLRSTGRTVDLVRLDIKSNPSLGLLPPQWYGTVPLQGASAGEDALQIVVRLRDGSDVVAGEKAIIVSQAEYVVWTLDFEGDAATDEALANTAAIADGLKVPMTVMWNPRVWTTTQVSAERAAAMLAWTKGRSAKGDEVALHLHAWTDYVRDAGVVPRTAPNWAGRSDGYDVPLTAFDESETRKLIDRGLALMAQHEMPRPTSFRAGGLFANAANLRAAAAAGFTVDTSSTPAGQFGRLALPWTLAKDAQPYRPSREDANATGDLTLLEVPNIAGNTYGLTVNTIQSTIRDDLAMLAPPTRAATTRRVLTLVSHPGTIDGSERAAIEALLRAFAALRYDADSGPVRFVTLAQLAVAYK